MADEEIKYDEIKLDGDKVPDKFKGKSITEVLQSVSDTETAFHDKSEEAKVLQEKNEALEEQINAEPDPDPDPDPDPEEYDEYVTKKDMTKFQTDITKTITETIKANTDEVRVETNAQFERRQFVAAHPDLFKDKDEKTKNAIITQVAANAYAAGKKTLEEGLEAYNELGQHLGVSTQEAPPRVIPNPELETGVGEFETDDDELKHMIDVHKKTHGRISSTIKK